MGIEIERKFLLTGDSWRAAAQGRSFRQGYLARQYGRTVRIRTCNNTGFLTIKGPSIGFARQEFEYQIPIEDANILLEAFCEQPILEKMRYYLKYDGFTWEIDEFLGENQGLIIAEIELDSEDQPFSKPDWLGLEVTGDSRYYNSSLVRHPFKNWR
jgi:adenylate cyclase